MTGLEREVRRAVVQGGDRYVVVLRPAQGDRPPMVGVYERGRRVVREVSVASLYQILVEREVARRPRRTRRVARGLLATERGR